MTAIISSHSRQSAAQPLQRRQSRVLQRVDHHGEIAARQITSVHTVARRAMFEAMQTGMARRTAELAVPDQADLLQAINMAAGYATVNIISGMYRG